MTSKCQCDAVTNRAAADVGCWSFVGSSVPVMNEPMNVMIYETKHILNSSRGGVV